jgi:hypothetical protein
VTRLLSCKWCTCRQLLLPLLPPAAAAGAGVYIDKSGDNELLLLLLFPACCRLPQTFTVTTLAGDKCV